MLRRFYEMLHVISYSKLENYLYDINKEIMDLNNKLKKSSELSPKELDKSL